MADGYWAMVTAIAQTIDHDRTASRD